MTNHTNHDHSKDLDSAIVIFSSPALRLDDVIGSMNGPMFLTEGKITETKNCKIHIYPNDQNPPHFHVIIDTESVGFSIEKGERLSGHTGLKGTDEFIQNYWKGDRCRLADKWNSSRPNTAKGQLFKIPSDWLCEDAIRNKK